MDQRRTTPAQHEGFCTPDCPDDCVGGTGDTSNMRSTVLPLDPARPAVEAMLAGKARRRWLRRRGKVIGAYYTIQVPAHMPRNKLVTIAKFTQLQRARSMMKALNDLGFDAIITYGDWTER